VIAWPRRGRLWLLVGQAACLAAVVLAGRASAERASSDGQATWLAVAVAAALLSAAGNGIWLGAVRRAAGSRRQLVVTRLARTLHEPAATAAGLAVPAGATGAPVMVAGLTLCHQPDCPLVAGKAVVPASDGDGTNPCGWCLAP
jgi:hypothetical protein